MIVWNEKVRRSQDVINAVINELYKDNINTDGVAEIFNNGKEQGCVLKIFDKYNPNLDLCFWIYLASDRITNNEITVIVGKHINCNKLNMWDGDIIDSCIFQSQIRDERNSLYADDELCGYTDHQLLCSQMGASCWVKLRGHHQFRHESRMVPRALWAEIHAQYAPGTGPGGRRVSLYAPLQARV